MPPSEQVISRSNGPSVLDFTVYMANLSRFFDGFISLSWIAPQFGHFYLLHIVYYTKYCDIHRPLTEMGTSVTD